MSCPDWKQVVAARESEALPLSSEGALGPGEIEAALCHLESCGDCRAAAVAADPLLVFSQLHRRDAARPAADEAMKADVLAMIRASRVAPAPVAAPARARRRAADGARALRFTAGLALASLLSLAGGTNRSSSSSASVPAPAPPAVSNEFDDLAAWIDATALLAQPAVEDLDRPEARVYDLSNDDLAVVMIVDASLDV